MNAAGPSRYRFIILLITVLVIFGCLGFGRYGYTATLPFIQKSFGLDNFQAGAFATANLVGYLLMAVCGGALASHAGPRRVVALGTLLGGLGLLYTGLSRDLTDLALSRFLTGLGGGATNMGAMGLLAAWFPPRERGFATGVGIIGSSLGLIVAGPLAPRISLHFGPEGWRLCWYGYAGLTLLFALVAALYIRNRPPVNLADNGTPEATAPVKLKKIYLSARVWHIGLVYIAFGFSYMIYLTFYTKHLITGLGFSPIRAGNYFMFTGCCSVFCGVIWGTVSDRIGRKRALIIVYLLQAAAYLLMALAQGPVLALLSSLLFGLTAFSIAAIMAALCGDLFGHRSAAATLGFITLFFGLGQATSPSIAGYLANTTGSFVFSYLLAAGASMAGALGALTLADTPLPDKQCRETVIL
ncbi:MAG: MFS transporter [Fibrobacterota bacterium]